MTIIRAYIHKPPVQFQALIDQQSFTYPLDEVAYDSVAAGSAAQTQDGMWVLFGTTQGGDELGRQRLRKQVDGSTVYIGRSSQGTNDGEVDLQDNAWITVLWAYPVMSKLPFIADDGVIYKDSDIEVGTNTTNPPPVANAGTPMAGTIDSTSSKLRVTLPPDTNESFATADGASITDYKWFLPSGVTLVGGYADTDSQIEVDVDPGPYYVRLRVTDSNANTHETRVFIFARDPAADETIQTPNIRNHIVRPEGQSLDLAISRDLAPADYPDNTMVLLWDNEPADGTDRSHVFFWGWHQTDPATVQAQREGTIRETVLNCLDIGMKIATLVALPQALQDNAFRVTDDVPSITWNYMTSPHINKYFHYLLYWHSTVLEIAEWTWAADGGAYPFIILESGGSNLFDQVDRRCRAMVPDHRLTCTKHGQLLIRPDPQLQDSADRTSVVQVTLTEADIEDIRWTHQRPPRVHWLWGEAVGATSTKVIIDGEERIPTYFCRSPGDAPGQGEREQRTGEKLAKSQADLNSVTGHRYARVNARQSIFDIRFAGFGANIIEAAHMTWVQINLPAAYAAQRGLTLSNERGLPLEMRIDYRNEREGLVRLYSLRWERELEGIPAVTYIPPDIEDVDDENDTTTLPTEFFNPNLGDGQEDLVLIDANGSLYVTNDFQTASGSGGPTWTETSLSTDATTHYSFVVDPFSPGYIGTGTAINGWIVTETNIYYIEDMFAATPTVTNQHTFATTFTTALAALRGLRVIDASFGRFFNGDVAWVGVYSYYADETGHTGSWFIYSQDGGATWSSEAQISAHYNDNDSAGQNPPLYLSPKTPGLAYAMAFTATGTDPNANGYVSTDWGVTWTQISNPDIDPGERLAGAIHVPWPNNSGEDLVYHSYNDAVNNDPGTTSSFLTKRVEGTTITDISPLVSSLHYGPRIGKFGIRTYDSNRRYVAMVGLSDTNPDTHAAFVSDDYGNTWTTIVSPSQSDPRPREIAFSGSDRNVLYIWGQGGYIAYSDDFGSNVDDRSGNLNSSFSPTVTLGIAGGAS